MSVLVDYQIRDLARTKGLIEPFEPDQINPASYDVTLGNEILVENYSYQTRVWEKFDISKKRFSLQPGEFILAVTAEFVRIPVDIEAEFCLKSSRGREGWQHALAAYIDPGFQGRITLELKNYNRWHQLDVVPGLRIGQLRFTKLKDIPERPYNLTGRYNGDLTVQASKG